MRSSRQDYLSCVHAARYTTGIHTTSDEMNASPILQDYIACGYTACSLLVETALNPSHPAVLLSLFEPDIDVPSRIENVRT